MSQEEGAVAGDVEGVEVQEALAGEGAGEGALRKDDPHFHRKLASSSNLTNTRLEDIAERFTDLRAQAAELELDYCSIIDASLWQELQELEEYARGSDDVPPVTTELTSSPRSSAAEATE